LFDKEKEVFATFGVYYKTTKKPHSAELNSLERVRNILTTILINNKAEEEILISKERYDIVAMATNDAIYDCDLSTRKIVWNNGISSIFGFKSEDIDDSIEWAWKAVHPEDKERVHGKLTEYLKGKGNTFSDEFRCICADGSYKYVQNRIFIINDVKTGRAVRLIGAIQDITDQKMKELQLRQLNEALEERAQQLAVSNTELERFAYVASHDLQEPLRTITSFLQLLKRKYADKIDKTAEEYINYATDGADRMKQLIMDMLEYSRVNTQLNLNEEVDMRQVINDVLFNFSGKIKVSDAIIEVSDNMPRIHAVKTQMIQIMQNLISNAIKYQKPSVPPHITIRAEEKETEWEFSVKDEGIGIDEKFYEKIFIIFQRLHSKTQFSGTGIGLAICKKIIEKHNGRIWVESTPKVGSTFYFTIPKQK
jgi:two-component system CheB/CheR fusion protein